MAAPAVFRSEGMLSGFPNPELSVVSFWGGITMAGNSTLTADFFKINKPGRLLEKERSEHAANGRFQSLYRCHRRELLA
jgi:hypothetical protein